MWKLVIEDDEGKRTLVPLTRDEYTIGRKEGNSIRLTERNVSRDHAKLGKRAGITKDSPIFTLTDLTSYNGVYVNGLRVAERQELAHGDLIQIGDYRIVLQDDAVEASLSDDEVVAVETDDISDAPTAPATPAVLAPLRATNATFLEKPNRLVVLAGPNPGEEFPLVGDRLTIGRAEEATISINHNSVSRLHCEVHALGDARFEIVDKGSSNGVRVNGADLRRGIIEAGDVIELGDVKFKFVGEGQLFRPGTSESQQLAALGPRTATAVIQARPAGKSNLLAAILLGTILALGVILAVMSRTRTPHADPAPVDAAPVTTAVDTTGADTAMLADARRMCDIGDIDGAHQKASQLPANSPLHSSGDFKYIELQWASTTLQNVDKEGDPTARAALIKQIIDDPYVDASSKKTATARLAALDAAAASAGRDAGKRAGTRPDTSSGPRPLAVASNPRASVPSNPDPPPPRPAAVSVSDLILSGTPSDLKKARDILDPKVFGHRGTPDDIRQLYALCKDTHDQQCLTALKHL